MSFSSSVNSSTFSVSGIQFADGSRLTSATTPLNTIVIGDVSGVTLDTSTNVVIITGGSTTNCVITLPIETETVKIPNGFTITMANLFYYDSRHTLTIIPQFGSGLIFNRDTVGTVSVSNSYSNMICVYFKNADFGNGWIVYQTPYLLS